MELGTGRHAFITGGASGIGLGIADALAERGLKVTLADIDDQELALRIVLALEELDRPRHERAAIERRHHA